MNLCAPSISNHVRFWTEEVRRDKSWERTFSWFWFLLKPLRNKTRKSLDPPLLSMLRNWSLLYYLTCQEFEEGESVMIFSLVSRGSFRLTLMRWFHSRTVVWILPGSSWSPHLRSSIANKRRALSSVFGEWREMKGRGLTRSLTSSWIVLLTLKSLAHSLSVSSAIF